MNSAVYYSVFGYKRNKICMNTVRNESIVRAEINESVPNYMKNEK